MIIIIIIIIMIIVIIIIIIIMRLMRISNNMVISLNKLARTWITIALTSCLRTNRIRIISSLILHVLVTEGWTSNKRKRPTSILI